MGMITQISVSDGGVPKAAVVEAEVTVNGLVGDRQRHLKVHGGPQRAVCLWSQEIIEQLQAEGHAIAPGRAGENITLQGLDWAAIIPGVQLQLGDRVQLEVTDYAAPCRTIMRWFADRKYGRISQKHYPGQSRVYAKVRVEGTIRQGDRGIVLSGMVQP